MYYTFAFMSPTNVTDRNHRAYDRGFGWPLLGMNRLDPDFEIVPPSGLPPPKRIRFGERIRIRARSAA